MKILIYFIALMFALYGQAQTTEDLLITYQEDTIGGTLVLPGTADPVPLVILSSGSGAQDRDETINSFKPFKLMADTFQMHDIASFRYDDRGVGNSNGEFLEITIDDMSNDLLSIVDHLTAQYHDKFSRIYLLGHSQGGIVSASAAERDERISGLILMASPIFPLSEVINDQVTLIQGKMGKSKKQIERTLEFQDKAYKALEMDDGWEDLERDFIELFMSEIDALPEAQRNMIPNPEEMAKLQFSQQVLPMKTPQMKSLILHDPSRDLEKLDLPILALFGEKDTQVLAVKNRERLQSICAAHSLSCEIQTLESANHLFQKANTGMVTEYTSLQPAFLPGFMPALVQWIKTN